MAAIGNEEGRRLAVLRLLRIMDSGQEKDFDDIVKLAAAICEAPISLMSLIDDKRQWFKARVGLELQETSREESFCQYTIQQETPMVVSDATKDLRFMSNPLVTGPEGIRFYAGVPLKFRGENIGALCVKDSRTRTLSETQLFGLRVLGDQVIRQLELRFQNRQLQQAFGEAEQQKRRLRESNVELYNISQNLVSSEEEIRANVEQINQLREHMEARERQYRKLVEEATDVIFELDASARFVFVNQSMETLSGYSKEELIGKKYYTLVHPADVRQVMDFYEKQMLAKQETSYLEFRMAPRHGKEVWIGQKVKMFFDGEGRYARASSISRDVSLLKITERRLEESEKLYRLLADNSKDVISIFDLDAKITRRYVSPSVKTILGYEPEELVGRSGYFCVHPDDLDHVMKMTEEITLKGHPATVEYRSIRKDGSQIWIESTSSPMMDESGRMTGFQTTARDITRRKEFEESLYAAKEKAEDATKAKSQFLSMMSHEIRTPMNAIIGLSTLLMQNNPTNEQLENLKLLKFSGENLLTIINDILDFSKIEANKIELESIELNLEELIGKTVQVLQQRADEKALTIQYTFDPAIPRKLMGDPVRLSQIVTNLISNAVKFTEAGIVQVEVKSVGSRDGRHHLLLNVTDSGIGIDPDKLDSIFDRFAQAESATTRKYGGTGLGLSITRNLVKLMGGDITVVSRKGKGSTFSFAVSLKEVDESSLALSGGVAQPDRTSTKNVDVLLVEDNRVNQVVATGFLKRWGINVDIANNGKEAVEKVATAHYDLILMDLQMPEMDGYEATKRIRTMDAHKYKDLPIIALTASAMNGMKDKVMEIGMTDFVTKPFAPEDLRAKIFKYVA